MSADAQAKKKPQAPNKGAHTAAVDAIKADLSKLQLSLNEVRNQINGMSNIKSQFESRRNELKDKLKAFKDQSAAINKERKEIFEKLEALKASRDGKAKEIKSTREKLPFRTVQEVDAAIAALEKQLETHSLKLVEEKKIITEISNLKKSRGTITAASKEQEVVDDGKKAIDDLYAAVKVKDGELSLLRTQMDEVGSQLEKINSERDVEFTKLNSLYDQRTKIQTDIDTKKKELQDLYDEFRRVNNEFFQHQEAERQKQNEQRRAEREKRDEERRQVEFERQKEMLMIPAHETEISTCNALISYLRSLGVAGTDAASADGASSSSSSSSSNAAPASPTAASVGRFVSADNVGTLPKGIQGVVLLPKKSEREENYLDFGGRGKKKGSSSSTTPTKASPAAATAGAAATPKDSVVKLPITMLSEFERVKVEFPVNKSHVVRAIDDLKARKEHYEKEQARIMAENKEKLKALLNKDAAAPAAPAPAPVAEVDAAEASKEGVSRAEEENDEKEEEKEEEKDEKKDEEKDEKDEATVQASEETGGEEAELATD